jgi:iron complex outermembrane receptor protein
MLLSTAIAASAQDAGDVVRLDRIEVTGSNIPRVDGESGLPVQVFTREQMIDGGMQTMQDLLERISANQSFGSFNEAKGLNGSIMGFTAASLRGLGSQRTLVLLNGRRLAPYAMSGGQSVDLSGIPASAIERVEILKDGASAVYGTDAIGGVINFILRKDYQGAEVNANYYATGEGGGNNWRASATAGFGDLAKDRYNVFISADYFKQDPLKATQRESTKTGHLPDLGLEQVTFTSFPANIAQSDPFTFEPYGFPGVFNPTIPYPAGATSASCAHPISFPTAPPPSFRPYQCSFDAVSLNETIPQSEKINTIGRFTWQLDGNNQLFAEGSYYQGKFTYRITPTPVASDTVPTMFLSPTSRYYPAAFVASLPGGDPTQPVELLYRTVELGPRTGEATATQWNGVIGLNGTVRDWDYQLAANYTANQQVVNLTSGNVSAKKFGELLRSGIVNPFGFNDPSVVDLMRATQITGQANDNRASNYGVALQMSNAVYDLASVPLGAAFGLEGRRESLEQVNSDFVVSGDLLGGGSAVPSLPAVHRSVWSLFGEVNVALAKTLEADVAVRYDYYSDFGGTTNPKVTLRWQPDKTVLLRGAYGTGFRAPTLSDLFQPQSLNFPETMVPDPVRCPVTGEDSAECLGFYRVKTGGNPALQPETSQQVNAGVVIQPVTALSASVDFYWVRVKNVVEIVPLETIMGTDYARWAPGYVVRLPPDAQHPNLPGRIAYVVQYQTNVGTITTSGIDIGIQYKSPETPLGRLSLGLNGTYVLDYAHTGFENSLVPPSVGARGPDADGAIAQYRQYTQLDWAYGPWGATLANNYQSGYTEPCTPRDPSGCKTRSVNSYSVWDLQARYTGLKNTTLTLGVQNALNTAPPASNQTVDFQVGIDPSYADARGRTFFGALRYVF